MFFVRTNPKPKLNHFICDYRVDQYWMSTEFSETRKVPKSYSLHSPYTICQGFRYVLFQKSHLDNTLTCFWCQYLHFKLDWTFDKYYHTTKFFISAYQFPFPSLNLLEFPQISNVFGVLRVKNRLSLIHHFCWTSASTTVYRLRHLFEISKSHFKSPCDFVFLLKLYV